MCCCETRERQGRQGRQEGNKGDNGDKRETRKTRETRMTNGHGWLDVSREAFGVLFVHFGNPAKFRKS